MSENVRRGAGELAVKLVIKSFHTPHSHNKCCFSLLISSQTTIQHGFRKAENIEDALDSELAFYGIVFGIEDIPGAIELCVDKR